MNLDLTVSFTDYQLPLTKQQLAKNSVVDIWLWPLDGVAGGLFPAASPDSPPMNRKTLARARRMSGRFMQRMILGAYLGLPGKSVHLLRSNRGRPYLDPEQHHSDILFNTSHSGGWQMMALAEGVQTGIDIELLDHRHDARAIAGRHFNAHENEYLAGLSEAQRYAGFIRLWNGKEAVLKALGCGLAGNMKNVTVLQGPPARAEESISGQVWQLIDVQPFAELYATLAVPDDRPLSIRARRIRLPG